jgi:hypothetical protein
MTYIITLPIGYKPVLKHGDHDQSSHGSWATGITEELSNWSPKEKVPDAPRNATGTTPKFWDNWEHGVDGDQFVDLYRQYAGEMLGLPVPKSDKDVGGAENYLTQRGFGASSTEAVRNQTEAVLNAIANGRPQPTLYRGMAAGNEESKALLEQFTRLEKGDTIDMPLVSTTRSLGVAEWYAVDRSKTPNDSKVILKIQEGAKGVSVNPKNSWYPSDFETITSGKFEVVGKSEVTVPYWSRSAVIGTTFRDRDDQMVYRVSDPNDPSWGSKSDAESAVRFKILKDGINSGDFSKIETPTIKYTNDRNPGGVKEDASRIAVNVWKRQEPKTFTVIEVKMVEPHVVKKGADLGMTFHNLFNDIPFIRDEEEVAKHGEHDQSEHGNWSTGSSELPKGIGYEDSDVTFHSYYDTSQEQGTYLEDYTMNAYGPINQYLRTGKWQEDNDSYLDKSDFEEYRNALDYVIDRTETPRDMLLYRGVSGVDKFDTLKEGDTFKDKGYASTTTEPEQLWSFMSTALGGTYDSRTPQTGVVLQISVPKGSKVLSVNRYFKGVGEAYGPSESIREENEHIFPRNTKFRVDSVGSVNVRGTQDRLIKVTVVNDD